MRLIAKENLPSGRYKKIYEKDSKPSFKRLLESPYIDECKAELIRRASLLNPVQLKQKMDKARERLFRLSVIEFSIPSVKISQKLSARFYFEASRLKHKNQFHSWFVIGELLACFKIPLKNI